MTTEEQREAKVREYIRAAYRHALPVRNLDTGEVELPQGEESTDWIADTILSLMAEAEQEVQTRAYNDVWRSFKQKYGDTERARDGEIERWLRSFVVMSQINPQHFKSTKESE